MKAFILVVLLIAAAPAFGQSERYVVGTGLGWGAARGGTWHWYKCAEGAGVWGSGMLTRLKSDRVQAIVDAGWNLKQLDQLREQYEAGEEPTPPTYGPSVSTASNGWVWLRRALGAFNAVVDAYTYWRQNKNYKASVLYSKIHDHYNDRIDALDGNMRSRTENCVYMLNERGSVAQNLKIKYDIGYTGINGWLAYPVRPRKGVVTVRCVANC